MARDDQQANDIRALKQYVKYPTDEDMVVIGWRPHTKRAHEIEDDIVNTRIKVNEHTHRMDDMAKSMAGDAQHTFTEIEELKERLVGYHERIGALERLVREMRARERME
ncbi:MAG: hypothetical protein MPL62_04420 [Alphaproteobacteria bacterium]|nr:hypothetical protein [Alphaproteobacteria bacterium]